MGGWGAWSLVVQRGVTELVGTLMAWQAYPWWPELKVLDPGAARQPLSDSVTMTYAQVLYVALVRVQDVIIGRFIGTAAVGQYRTAWRTVELISQGVIMPFTQVALPTLGRLQDDLPAFRKAYLRITAVCSAVAVPAIVGFAVVAPDVIPLVFGPSGRPDRLPRHGCSGSWQFPSPTTALPRRRSPRWAAMPPWRASPLFSWFSWSR